MNTVNHAEVALALIKAWRSGKYKQHGQAKAALQVLIMEALKLTENGNLPAQAGSVEFWVQQAALIGSHMAQPIKLNAGSLTDNLLVLYPASHQEHSAVIVRIEDEKALFDLYCNEVSFQKKTNTLCQIQALGYSLDVPFWEIQNSTSAAMAMAAKLKEQD